MPIPVGTPTATTGATRFAFGETIALITAGTVTDPYSGEPSESWADEDVTSVDVPGVGVANGGSTEPLLDARNSVESDYDLFFPPTATVTRLQRVVVRGNMCDVVGRPFLWRNPFTGWTPGLVVQAKLREG